MEKTELKSLLDAIRQERRDGPSDKTKHHRVRLGIYSVRGLPRRYTVRVRVPGGVISPAQLRVLSHIAARESAYQRLHITTRQGIEIPGVRSVRIGRVLTAINVSGLTTDRTGGNAVRGIVCCAYSGVSPDSLFDVTPTARSLDAYLRSHPKFQHMPRKIKIALESCRLDHVRSSVSDIGIRAARLAGKQGFTLTVGGGLGAVPSEGHVLEPFTALEDLTVTVLAVLSVFDANGNRQNRSRARLKWLIQERGITWFRSKVMRERDVLQATHLKNEPFRSEPVPIVPSRPHSYAGPRVGVEKRWFDHSVRPTIQSGLWSVSILVPLGELSPTQAEGLSNIATKCSSELRLTVEQNIVLPFVPEDSISMVREQLKELSLASCCAEGLPDVSRCAGSEVCLSGALNSRAAAGQIAARLQERFSNNDAASSIRVRVSGCANSCGHHHLSDIGLFGIPKRCHDKVVPHYSVLLSGLRPDSTFAGHVIDVPAANVVATVENIVGQYVRERNADEPFSGYARRVGIERWKKNLGTFGQVPPPDSAPEFYRDLGEESSFRLNIKAGECSA